MPETSSFINVVAILISMAAAAHADWKATEWGKKLNSITSETKSCRELGFPTVDLERILRDQQVTNLLGDVAAGSLRNIDSSMYQKCAEGFAKVATPETLKALTDKFLAAADTSVRQQLATLIRALNRPDLLPYLQEMLRDPRLWEGANTSLLNAVSWAIASTGDPDSIRKVIEAAAKTEGVHQNALALGLACLNSPKAAPMLASIVTGGDTLSVNRFAFLLSIKLLGQIPESRSVPLLQRLQESPDEEVAKWSRESLQLVSRSLEELAAKAEVSKNN